MSQTVDREFAVLGGIGALMLGLIAGVESAGLVGALFASGPSNGVVVLRQANFGTALLVYEQLPPVWTEQRLLFDDPQLRALVPAEVRTGMAGDRADARSGLWRWADAG